MTEKSPETFHNDHASSWKKNKVKAYNSSSKTEVNNDQRKYKVKKKYVYKGIPLRCAFSEITFISTICVVSPLKIDCNGSPIYSVPFFSHFPMSILMCPKYMNTVISIVFIYVYLWVIFVFHWWMSWLFYFQYLFQVQFWHFICVTKFLSLLDFMLSVLCHLHIIGC